MEKGPAEEKVEGTPKKKGLPSWLAYAAPAVLVAVTVLIYFLFKPSDSSEADEAEGGAVQMGKDYYVYVSLVELHPTDPNGNSWDDPGDGEAPDIRVDLKIKGVAHPTSANDLSKDRMIAIWSGVGVGLKDALGNNSPQTLIKVPLASFEEKGDDRITILVYEVNLGGKVPLIGEAVGGIPVIGDKLKKEKKVAEVSFHGAQLVEGKNTFSYELAKHGGLKRIELKMLRSDMSQADLTKQLLLGQ